MNGILNLQFRTFLGILLAVAVLAACNNQPAASPGLSPEAEATTTPAVLDYVPPRSTPEIVEPILGPTPNMTTGIPEVDSAVAVILAADPDARLTLLQLTTAGCTKVLGLGSPPKCESDQVEGTPVEYLPVLGPGEGVAVLPQAINRSLDFKVQTLYLAYQRIDKPVNDPYFAPGAYTLVFTTSGAESVPFIAVHLNDEGRIVRLDYMVWDPLSLMEQEAEEVLVPPPQIGQAEFELGESTPTPTPFVIQNAGQIVDFTAISDRERPGPGDRVTLTGETVGGSADICVSYGGWTNSDCFDVLASGQRTITLRTEDPVADHWVDFILTVRDEFLTINKTVRIPVKCHYKWFEDNLSSWCPFSSVNESEAVAQVYESGLSITQGTMSTVFFDEPGNPCRAYFTRQELDLDFDPLQPPPNRFAPDDGMAVLWLGAFAGTEDLRPRLGWPISAPDGRVFISPPDFVTIPDPDGVSEVGSTCTWIDSRETDPVDPTSIAGDRPCASPFYMVWASHELDELSNIVQEALDESNVEGALAIAFAYGEDWVEYDAATRHSEACNFSIMETDFHVTLLVEDLSDLDNLGEQLAALISVLHEFPPIETPGSQPGIIRITLLAGNENLVIQFSAFTLAEAIADGLSGAALYEALRD